MVFILSFFIGVGLGVLLCNAWKLPDRCVLCEGIRYHAPCMLNLTTGEVVEMELYEPHPKLVAEIASFHPRGDWAIMYGAGLTLNRDRAKWKIDICLQHNEGYLKYTEFCYFCRFRLLKYRHDKYVIVDLYDRKHPSVYPVKDGAEYNMRCYTVTVSKEDAYRITLKGKLPNYE